MIQLAVDAAHWWGPVGWLYRNTPGNLAASLIWIPLAGAGGWLLKGRKVVRELHDRHDAQDRALARIHRHLGIEPQPPEGSSPG